MPAVEFAPHPVLAMFPMRTDDEIEKLAFDIHNRGQQEPILVYRDTIVDGRARLLACQMAGVVPALQGWVGPSETDVIQFVVKRFMETRTLTKRERIVWVALIYEWCRTRHIRVVRKHLTAVSGLMTRSAEEVYALLIHQRRDLLVAWKEGHLPTLDLVADLTRYQRAKPTPAPKATRVYNAASSKRKQERIERIREMAAEGYSPQQMGVELGITAEHVRGLARDNNIEIKAHFTLPKRHNAMQMMENVVLSAEGLTAGLDLIRIQDLDSNAIMGWTQSLRRSVRQLNLLITQLNQRKNDNGNETEPPEGQRES